MKTTWSLRAALLFLVVLFALSDAFAAEPLPAARPTLVVFDFGGSVAKPAELVAARTAFEAALLKTGAFAVIARADALKALSGSGLSLAATVDPAVAAKVAAKVGADFAIIGGAVPSGKRVTLSLWLVEAKTGLALHSFERERATWAEAAGTLEDGAAEFASWRERKDKAAKGGEAGTTGDADTFYELSADSRTSVAASPAPTGGVGSSVTEKASGGWSGAASSSSGLKAGYADDNDQYARFLAFLEDFKRVQHRPVDVGERVQIVARDSAGKPLPSARLTVLRGSAAVDRGTTYSDGTFYVYPSMYAGDSWTVELEYAGATARTTIARKGPRSVEIRVPATRSLPATPTLDVLFVLDTTGSMGEEINSLRDSIDLIKTNLLALRPTPRLRFGLVLYKDRGDVYVTQKTDFTSDIDLFRAELGKVRASGGADYPEDLEEALRVSVEEMSWAPGSLKTAFVITDAPGHVDYGNDYTYVTACLRARELGIKIYTVGTGGMSSDGEYQLRQVAQLTQARYIFLTYGEKGDSEGGKDGSVSHHVGGNFVTDRLEVVVTRFVKDEFAAFTGQEVTIDDSYFEASKIDSETRDQTLAKLFDRAIDDLLAMATMRVPAGAKCSVMPISVAAGSSGLETQAEFFSTNLLLAASRTKAFVLIDRKDLQKVLAELDLALSGLVDEKDAAKVGKVYGAEYLVTGELYRRADRYDLFLKLVRVETAEVLAITALRIDLSLGL